MSCPERVESERVEASGQAPPGRVGLPDLSYVSGVGVNAGDAVRAVIGASGRLESLIIDPELLGSDSEDVADAVLEAVQAAQADAARQVAVALGGLGARGTFPESDAGMRQLDSMRADLDALTRRLASL